MKRLAMILNGEVVNTIVWDGIQRLDFPNYELIDVTMLPHVSIGWRYEGGVFTKPENEQEQ